MPQGCYRELEKALVVKVQHALTGLEGPQVVSRRVKV